MKKLFLLFGTLVMIGFLPGCGNKSAGNVSELIDREWMIREIIYADSSYTVKAPSAVTIAFSDSSSVSGRGTCNSFFGVYNTMGEDRISIQLTGSTLALCLDQDFKDRYFMLLDNTSSYRVDRDELWLYDLEKTVTLLFRPVNAI